MCLKKIFANGASSHSLNNVFVTHCRVCFKLIAQQFPLVLLFGCGEDSIMVISCVPNYTSR